ncbi:hypothetical protein E0K89_004700 [Aquicoccus sp. SCR17]|nr:hypothetical protein [Carideicomes alvinocaridis]
MEAGTTGRIAVLTGHRAPGDRQSGRGGGEAIARPPGLPEREAVPRLSPRQEGAGLDSLRLLMLHDALGTAGAMRLVLEVRADLTLRLPRVERLFRRGARADLAAAMHSLISLCDQVGLGRLAQVAGHVADCLRRGDDRALSANMERLQRLGQRAIAELDAACGLG